MSYDISIVDSRGNVLQAEEPHHINGGTYSVNGTKDLHFNITYNYCPFFREHLDATLGIRWLYGQQVITTIPKLLQTICKFKELEKTWVYQPASPVIVGEELVGPPEEDSYWAPTPANARVALQNLVALGAFAPEGFWEGD